MNHIAAIWAGYLKARSRHESCILGTIVHTQGSTYRKPGARMLIMASGESIGMLSGGCLERDILAHCEQVFQSGESRLVTYDTGTEEDIRWGFGLGCDGAVQVLLEVLREDGLNPLVGLMDAGTQAIATVFDSALADVPIGARVVLGHDQWVTTALTNAELVRAIAADCHRSSTTTYNIGPHQIQVFVEVVQPMPQLTIFGAGRDVLPVVSLAKTLGWAARVVDCRGEVASRERFAQADAVTLTRREVLAEQVEILPSSIVVIMTHNYFDDVAILETVLPIQPRYVGILGSRSRSEKLVAELSSEMQALATQLHRPIGLDLGGETPEEIALAIVAEVQAVLHNRQGIFLKHRQEPIHSLDSQYVSEYV